MAKKKLASKVLRKPAVSTVKVFPILLSFTLPDGTVLTKGDLVSVVDVPGVFRFQYARNGDVTVYGGTGTGDKVYHSMRSFKPADIGAKLTNVAAIKLAAVATMGLPEGYAEMSPGQKAAFTKRMNAAAKVMVAA